MQSESAWPDFLFCPGNWPKADNPVLLQVDVTLWNSGEDAYRPDVYGQFITIQRKVGSGAGYQMSGERGNIVSRSRDEMLAIVDHLSIDAGA